METDIKTISKTELNATIAKILRENTTEVENARVGNNVFVYAACCEHYFELNLKDMTGKERKYTFYSDLSIGEWYGIDGVTDTLRRCFTEWIDSCKAIAELLISINYKSWEMAARGLQKWSVFYAKVYDELYYAINDYYEGRDMKAAEYVATYLD